MLKPPVMNIYNPILKYVEQCYNKNQNVDE